ncbi:MAG: TetR/AcrR family transcriptional regulator [Magnetococcales bacterium]|nr:TetR/AcrR family transcriptional regulator [Magnetococcales bacterium]
MIVMGIQERRERDFLRRERDILDAALGLLDHDDWQSVTIAQIATKAEIGKGTIYKHFATKEEIYARLSLDFGDEMLAAMRRLDHNQPVLDLLRALMRLALKYHVRGMRYHRVLMFCRALDFRRRLSPEAQKAMDDKDMEFDTLFGTIIEKGIEEGIFPRMPIEKLTWGAHAAFEGTTLMLWNELAGATDEQKQEFIDTVIHFMLVGMVYQDRKL